jgi:hypothetical protein
LGTRTYEIEFPDGRSDEYTANVIAENMYAQCDIEGRQYNLMEGIVDHKTYDHAIEPADMYIKHGSNKQVRKTTKGWHLCVEWKMGLEAGSAWWISRKATQLKLLNMHLQRACLMPLLLCGGLHMSSRSTVELVLMLQSVTISALTSLGLTFPKAGMNV